MDNIRLVLWVGLGTLCWLTLQAWQKDYAPPPITPGTESVAAPTDTLPATDDLPQLPDSATADRSSTGETAESADLPASARAAPTLDLVRVRTDVLDVWINPAGGDLFSATLPEYPVHKDRPNESVSLLSGDPESIFAIDAGLRSLDGAPEPNHLAVFTTERTDYELADGQNELVVTLNWQGENGLSGTKRYRFRRGSYAIDLEQAIDNGSAATYRAVSYLQIRRRHAPPKRSMFDVDSYSFVGPVVYDGEKYEKYDADDLLEEPFEQVITGGWIASIQHHFLAAAVPSGDGARQYAATYDGKNTLLRAIDTEATSIAPGERAVFDSTLFVGPKLQAQLAEVADGLTLTVDYGMLTILAQPLFWLLQTVFDFIGNWGWTIIIVTVMIKLVFYKLTEKSGRSMAKMRKIAPRLKAVQERHKDDREALSKAMMDLYKREKVNPAAGCWPMLIQIPFFIAFYWVLLESVEMRQAPFMLWITDLSTRDPFFILPLLMGAAMFFQQRLNPPPPDPMQAKVMQFLPLIFTGMFAFFPAGLVLYWLTNSVLSMAQQWRINKVIGAD